MHGFHKQWNNAELLLSRLTIQESQSDETDNKWAPWCKLPGNLDCKNWASESQTGMSDHLWKLLNVKILVVICFYVPITAGTSELRGWKSVKYVPVSLGSPRLDTSGQFLWDVK